MIREIKSEIRLHDHDANFDIVFTVIKDSGTEIHKLENIDKKRFSEKDKVIDEWTKSYLGL